MPPIRAATTKRTRTRLTCTPKCAARPPQTPPSHRSSVLRTSTRARVGLTHGPIIVLGRRSRSSGRHPEGESGFVQGRIRGEPDAAQGLAAGTLGTCKTTNRKCPRPHPIPTSDPTPPSDPRLRRTRLRHRPTDCLGLVCRTRAVRPQAGRSSQPAGRCLRHARIDPRSACPAGRRAAPAVGPPPLRWVPVRPVRCRTLCGRAVRGWAVCDLGSTEAPGSPVPGPGRAPTRPPAPTPRRPPRARSEPGLCRAGGYPPVRNRLTRSHDNRVIGGVLGGLARYWNTDPLLLRILTIVLTIATGGALLLGYIIAWIVIPLETSPPSGLPGTAPATPRAGTRRTAHRAAIPPAARRPKRPRGRRAPTSAGSSCRSA